MLVRVACISTSLSMFHSKPESVVWGDTYKVTSYCNCALCCGKAPTHPAYGITASGKKARAGTIAVDRKVIPMGSKVWIEGIGECRAEDTGGAIKGRHIDVWMPTHRAALVHGVKYLNVKVLPN